MFLNFFLGILCSNTLSSETIAIMMDLFLVIPMLLREKTDVI
jgi:hypothetical protein